MLICWPFGLAYAPNTTGFPECVLAVGNFCFAEALYRTEIGTPISQYGNSVKIWIRRSLKEARLLASNSDRPRGNANLLEELIDMPDVLNGGGDDGDSKPSHTLGARSLLVIKTDLTD